MTKAQTIAEIKAELARLKKQLALVEAKKPKKRTVINLMSGKITEIDEDTPLCCDPSSETYWSM